MSKRKGKTGLVGVTVVMLGLAAPALAGEDAPRTNGMLSKLGRGLANVATCPLELIRMPELIGRKDGMVAGTTVGIVKGLWQGLVRGVTGVFEVATFYAEIPKGYAPLVKPEFVWADGNWAE